MSVDGIQEIRAVDGRGTGRKGVKDGERDEENMNLWTSNQHFHKAANAKWEQTYT